MAENGQHVERRTILRSIAAGGTLAAGAGIASAGSGPEGRDLSLVNQAEQRYGDVDSVQRLFDVYGRPVVGALVDDGYLDPGTSVSVDSVVSRHEFGDVTESGVAAVGDGARDGEHVVDVRVHQRTDDHEIEYHLNPGVGDGYAVVSGDDETTLVLPDGTENVVTTDYCCPDECSCGEYRCTDQYCDCQSGNFYYYRERFCCITDDNGICYCSWEDSDSCGCREYSGHPYCPQ